MGLLLDINEPHGAGAGGQGWKGLATSAEGAHDSFCKSLWMTTVSKSGSDLHLGLCVFRFNMLMDSALKVIASTCFEG